MKILVLSDVDHIPGILVKLSNIGNVIYRPGLTRQQAVDAIRENNPNVLYVNPNNLMFKIEKELLHSSVKAVCSASTGTNHIDVKECMNKGIKVIAITTEYDILKQISSTAELAFGLMLSMIRKIPAAFDSVKRYEWDCMNFLGRQLRERNVGIVGYGRLGKMMAHYCDAFDMNVLVCDPFVTSPFSNISLEEMSSVCEIISLHVHLNDRNRSLINDALVSRMKDVCLINTSRGEIVDEDAVLLGLKNGNIWGYAADVIKDELGNVKNSNLIKNTDKYNILLTPHIGGASIDAQLMAYGRACDLLLEWKNDQQL